MAHFIRSAVYAALLVLGATFFSFFLMAKFGSDKTYELAGKHSTKEHILELRHELRYDRPVIERYVAYLKKLVTLDFGRSDASGEEISSILRRTLPVSLAFNFPGFFLGEAIALLMAILATATLGRWPDKLISTVSTFSLSLSFVIVVVGLQAVFCSPYALDLFPILGWDTQTLGSYLKHTTVATLCYIVAALGYNVRVFRAILADEMGKEYVTTAIAYGCPKSKLLFKHVLANALGPITTRIVFSLPTFLFGGSFILENAFSIPGIGLTAHDALLSGDQPLAGAIMGITILTYVVCLSLADILYRYFDPRVALR